MAEQWSGKVEEVGIYPVGAETLSTAPVGATSVLVDSIGSFSEYGGRLTVGDAVDPIYYSGVDEDASTLLFAEPLLEEIPEEAFLFQFPYSEERLASIRGEESEDSITCRLSGNVSTILEDGVRDIGSMETVTYEVDLDGEYVIVDVPAEAARLTLDSKSPEDVDWEKDLQDALDNLNNVVLPQLQADLTVANQQLDELNTITLPNLNIELSAATQDISNLRDVTIPQLNSDLDLARTDIQTLNSDLGTLNGKFPIVGTDISDGAISTPKMTANTINGDRILANTLQAAKIVAGSITTDRFTSNSINGDIISAGTLNANRIYALTITTEHMVAGTISGDRIAINTLDAGRIVAGSITTDKMTANTINGDRIATNTLHADKIIANTLQAAIVNAGAINGITITGSTLQTNTSGRRLVFDSISFRGYDGIRANPSIQLDADGDMYIGVGGSFFSEVGLIVQGASTFGGDISGVDVFTSQKIRMASPYTGDSGSGSAVRIFDNGQVFKVTSTLRHKADIEPFEMDPNLVYSASPVTYWRTDTDSPGFGYIAEWMEALGADRFVGHDSEGAAETFNYESWAAVGHQVAILDLHARLRRVEEALGLV